MSARRQMTVALAGLTRMLYGLRHALAGGIQGSERQSSIRGFRIEVDGFFEAGFSSVAVAGSNLKATRSCR